MMLSLTTWATNHTQACLLRVAWQVFVKYAFTCMRHIISYCGVLYLCFFILKNVKVYMLNSVTLEHVNINPNFMNFLNVV